MAERTTLKLGGPVLAEVVLEREDDIEALPELLRNLGGEPFVLGRGSNILAADRRLNLVLLRLKMFDAPAVVQEQEGLHTVRAAAGTSLPRLLGWLRARGLSGLEELAGIPGSVGGAVAMNAGSHGREMGQVLRRVLVWSPNQGAAWRGPGQWRTEYRRFDAGVAGRPAMILAAEFWLKKTARDEVSAGMRRWFAQKNATQPLHAASAGCVFKNPAPEQPAGLLLERAGLRGYRVGGMAFSHRHANFLVNLGAGRAEQAFELMELARLRVRERFGLALETEVEVLA